MNKKEVNFSEDQEFKENLSKLDKNNKISEDEAWEVIENYNHFHIAPAFVKNYRDAIEKGIKPDDLNSNKAIIPEFVGEWLENNQKCISSVSLYIIGFLKARGTKEDYKVLDWLESDKNNSKLFFTAWVNGWVPSEEQYYIKKKEKSNFLYFSKIEVYSDGKVNSNAESSKLHAIKANKKKAEMLAYLVDGEIEKV